MSWKKLADDETRHRALELDFVSGLPAKPVRASS